MVAAACLVWLGTANAAWSAVTVEGLSAARAGEPLGIDEPPPLGWRMASDERDKRQSAYQVQVASSLGQLTGGTPDKWDSGKVTSARSAGIPYGGSGLSAETEYRWRVRVWDEDGVASPWSEPGRWEMGPLGSGDWSGAQWITPGVEDRSAWTDYAVEVDVRITSRAAGVLFRVQGPLDYYLWQLNATGPEVLLRPHIRRNGAFSLLDEVPTGVPSSEAGTPRRLRIEVEGSTITTSLGGEIIDTRTDTRLSRGAIGFRSGHPLEDASFDNLAVTDADGQALVTDAFGASPDPDFPGAEIQTGELRSRSGDTSLIASAPDAPLLRSDFTLAAGKQVAKARLYSYGLGFARFRLTGETVGERVLAPSAMDLEDVNRFDTVDVTDLLQPGENTLGVELAEGYGRSFSAYADRWLGPRQAKAKLAITYTDGTKQNVTTGPAWRWSDGPIRAATIYGGETYDARLEQPGWDTPAFDDQDWATVGIAAAPSSRLWADQGPPIKVQRTITPIGMTEPEPGVYVFDLGENIAGWTRLQVSGAAGTRIELRHAENITAAGALDTYTNRNAAQTDTYILKGDGPETYEPSFTYHGFRYVEVRGLPAPPQPGTIAGRVVHADLRSTASFTSSEPLLDQIYANNRRTMLNNAMSIPTDNPVRDERTGPPMDVQAYAEAGIRDFDMHRFLRSYLEAHGPGYGLSPDMRGTWVPLNWWLYEQYEDVELLAASYPRMAQYVDSLVTSEPDLVWGDTPDDGFGDWCAPLPAATVFGGLGSSTTGEYETCFNDIALTNTALFYRAARIVARSAEELGRDADAEKYATLAKEIAAAFEARFSAAGDTYGSGRQTTSVLPLAFGMVPEERVAAVGAALAERVAETDGGHLGTGIFGTRYLIDALAAAGRADLALGVLRKQTYPSYGFQIAQGATTAWEQWTYRAGMETHDHAMFTGINASYITHFGGITPLEPGYRRFRVDPAVPSGMQHATVTLDTVRGQIRSAWSSGGAVREVTVPPNAVAEVHVPLPAGHTLQEGGAPAAGRDGVRIERVVDGVAVVEVGSGSYRFTTVAPVTPETQDPPSSDDDEPPPTLRSPDPAPPAAPGTPPRSGSTKPAPKPQPRLRLTARLRKVKGARFALEVRCRSGCPRRGVRRRATVTVFAAGSRRRVRLLRATGTYAGSTLRITIAARRLRGRGRVSLTVAGLSPHPVRVEAAVPRP